MGLTEKAWDETSSLQDRIKTAEEENAYLTREVSELRKLSSELKLALSNPCTEGDNEDRKKLISLCEGLRVRRISELLMRDQSVFYGLGNTITEAMEELLEASKELQEENERLSNALKKDQEQG